MFAEDEVEDCTPAPTIPSRGGKGGDRHVIEELPAADIDLRAQDRPSRRDGGEDSAGSGGQPLRHERDAAAGAEPDAGELSPFQAVNRFLIRRRIICTW